MAQYDSALVSKSKRNLRKFSDIDIDFTRNLVTSDVNKIEDVIAVKRAVKNLVQTNFYERPFQPELGCGIRELLFEPYSPLTAVFLKRKISEVITNHEPRVRLEDISLDDDPDRNRLKVDLYFYVVGVSEPVTVSTFLQRLR